MKKGFSLIEVIIFVSIISVVFILAVTITVGVLRQLKVNEHKILATRYAEEAMEWIRDEKEVDWTIFTAKGGKTYCLNTALNWNNQSNCSSTYSLDSYYSRIATLTSKSVSGVVYEIDVDVKVQWQEGGNTYSVPVTTALTVYE